MTTLVGAATFLEVALRSPRVRWLRELVFSRRCHRDEHATASGAFYDSFGSDGLTDDNPPTSPPPESTEAQRGGPEGGAEGGATVAGRRVGRVRDDFLGDPRQTPPRGS